MLLYTAEPTPMFHEKLLVWKSGGVLRALDMRGYETRNESVLRLIEQADTAHAAPDFPPLLVHTGDRPMNDGDPSWRSAAFSTAEGYVDLPVPDFVFDRWPQSGLADYEGATREIVAAGAAPAITPKLGWIGNCETNPIRWTLHALGQAHRDLMEVDHLSWVAGAGADRLATARRLETERGNYLSLADQVRRWALLIDVEGNGLSGRLKLLLHGGRPLLVQDRPWQEWFMGDLEPMMHYIPVKRDLSDLLDRLRWAISNPEGAARIGRQGQQFALLRLRREDALASWAQTFRTLAAREPVPYAPAHIREVLDPVIAQIDAAVAG
jgi:Glycosyl transferase family 90